MQYDVTTPEEYFEALENDWRREKVEKIRALIKASAPELVEGIDYKMLSYRDDKSLVFGLNAQKHYVSFYVGDISKIDPDGSLLQGLNLGKGCIRLTKTKVIEKTGLGEFIERATQMWRKGEDVYC